MDSNGITEAVRQVIAQAQSFAVPCIFIIIVTMGTIMARDILGALIRGPSKGKPRGPRHHQVW